LYFVAVWKAELDFDIYRIRIKYKWHLQCALRANLPWTGCSIGDRYERSEDGGATLHRNFGNGLQYFTASEPRESRLKWIGTVPW